MLNLFEYLTEEDSNKIEVYVKKFGSQNYIGNEEWLKYWAENKKKLFHLLDGQLIYKVPFTYSKNDNMLEEEIRNLVNSHEFISMYYDLIDELFSNMIEEERKNSKERTDEYFNLVDLKRHFHRLLSTSVLKDNAILDTIKYKSPNKKKILQFQKGTKPIKALQKTLDYFDATEELKNALENFRIKLSMILNEKQINANLCFSIHPLDFITMSDNANNWSSCMSWQDSGCYHLGTVEMMNSNNVICVYLESESTTFTFGNESWNSKKWRQLFYCTKEIIVGGKAYPFYNEEITKSALDILRKLAKKNWNKEYTYGIEKYSDMIHMQSAYRIEKNREWIKTHKTTKHNIIFDTHAMYNDMFNDQDTIYWCIRNKVKKNTIIRYSGKAPCVCCMKEVTSYAYPDPYNDDTYNSRYEPTDNVICKSCIKDFKCAKCGVTHPQKLLLTKNNYRLCEDCAKTYTTCPICDSVYLKEYYLNAKNEYYIRFEEDIYFEDIYFEDIVSYNKPNYNSNSFEITDEEKVLYCDICPNCKDNIKLHSFYKTELFRHADTKLFNWMGDSVTTNLSKKIYKRDDPSLIKYLPRNRRIPEISEITY